VRRVTGSAHVATGAVVQVELQLPQWVTVDVISVSQPLVAFTSQSPHPALQPIWHAPETHVGVPWLALQTLVHEPQ
jgi:hypothetical protein